MKGEKTEKFSKKYWPTQHIYFKEEDLGTQLKKLLSARIAEFNIHNVET